MKMHLYFFLACTVFSNECLSKEQPNNNTGNNEIVSRECKDVIGLENDLDGVSVYCDYLVVPENYEIEDSKLIKIPFLVAYSPDTISQSNNPLIITGGGGPGSAYLKSSSKYQFALSEFGDYFGMSIDRGSLLIVLENRGVGQTNTNLGCPEVVESIADTYKLDTEASTASYLALVETCINRINSKGIDITQYHVENTAKDIENLRLSLKSTYEDNLQNFDEIDLYGISYGTRVALYYEMLYPDNTRSMILDSAVAHSKNPIRNDVLYSQISFDLLFERCMTDTVCKDTYGADLEVDFYAYLDELHSNPTHIYAINPHTLKSEKYLLDTYIFINILIMNTYSYSTYTNLPYVIRTIVNGSLQELSRLFTIVLADEMYRSLDDVAFFSYLCFDNSYEAESMEMFEKNPEAFPLYQYAYAPSADSVMYSVCNKLEMSTETEYLTTQHKINTPVLLLSGKADTITPANEARTIKNRADIAWMFEWDNVAHHVISHMYCPGYVAAAFLDAPSTNPETGMEQCFEPEHALFHFVH